MFIGKYTGEFGVESTNQLEAVAGKHLVFVQSTLAYAATPGLPTSLKKVTGRHDIQSRVSTATEYAHKFRDGSTNRLKDVTGKHCIKFRVSTSKHLDEVAESMFKMKTLSR